MFRAKTMTVAPANLLAVKEAQGKWKLNYKKGLKHLAIKKAQTKRKLKAQEEQKKVGPAVKKKI